MFASENYGEDWNKLDELFEGITEKYDDYVYKFNVIQGLTDVWDDINFYDKTTVCSCVINFFNFSIVFEVKSSVF